METDIAAVLVQADNAMDFLRREQVAMLGIAEPAFGAMKLPKSWADHGGASPSEQTFTWESVSESRKGTDQRAMLLAARTQKLRFPSAGRSTTQAGACSLARSAPNLSIEVIGFGRVVYTIQTSNMIGQAAGFALSGRPPLKRAGG